MRLKLFLSLVLLIETIRENSSMVGGASLKSFPSNYSTCISLLTSSFVRLNRRSSKLLLACRRVKNLSISSVTQFCKKVFCTGSFCGTLHISSINGRYVSFNCSISKLSVFKDKYFCKTYVSANKPKYFFSYFSSNKILTDRRCELAGISAVLINILLVSLATLCWVFVFCRVSPSTLRAAVFVMYKSSKCKIKFLLAEYSLVVTNF